MSYPAYPFPQLNGRFQALNEIWRTVQYGPPEGPREILRWSGWREKHPSLARQNLHQHEISLLHLINITLSKMMLLGAMYDFFMIFKCALLHDYGERYVGDIAQPKKKAENDLSEYLAFEAKYRRLSDEEWPIHQRCFLLQTAEKNPACFPADARSVMADLQITHPDEALIFYGFERFDYLMTAYNGFHQDGIVPILFDVANHHVDSLNRVAEKIPSFRDALWTPEVSEYFNRAAETFRRNPHIFRDPQLMLFSID